jgi:hypothetical protein
MGIRAGQTWVGLGNEVVVDAISNGKVIWYERVQSEPTATVTDARGWWDTKSQLQMRKMPIAQFRQRFTYAMSGLPVTFMA